MPRKQRPIDEAVFLRARFAGGRFDRHTLPLELLPDLSSYRRLVVEVAKHIFKQTHGDRVRVPKGFEESFAIAVLRVQGGNSSTADLVISDCGTKKQPGLFAEHPEFEEARNLINRVIAEVARGRSLPSDFPDHLVGLFNPFGQSLLPGEFIDLSAANAPSARYSDSIRRQIVLSGEGVVEAALDAEFTLNGGVVNTSTIHLLDPEGRRIDFQPTSKFEFDEAYRRASGLVRLVGSGLFDANGLLRRVLNANFDFNRPAFHVEVADAFQDAQAQYPHDDADAPQVYANLRALRSHIEASSDPNLELGRPYIYILEDEEISVEWTTNRWEASIQMKLPGESIQLHGLNTESSESIWDELLVRDGARLRSRLSRFLSTIAAPAQGE